LSPVLLYGKLRIWLEAYSQTIEAVQEFMFGWINIAWISISTIETHLLVITGIICASYARAEVAFQKNKRESGAWFIGIGTGVLYFSFVFVPVLLLPSMYGFSIAAIVMIVVSFMVLLCDNDKAASSKSARMELIGTLSVFAILIALNYSLFQHWK
jgi:hypothetical protein